jgi:hypothetical protein
MPSGILLHCHQGRDPLYPRYAKPGGGSWAAFFAADGDSQIHEAQSGIHKLLFQTLLFESGLPTSENASRSKVADLLPKARTRKVTTIML